MNPITQAFTYLYEVSKLEHYPFRILRGHDGVDESIVDALVLLREAVEKPFCLVRIISPINPIDHPTLLEKTAEQARSTKVDCFIVWNLRDTALWQTPPKGTPVSREHRLKTYFTIHEVTADKNVPIDALAQTFIKSRAKELLDDLTNLYRDGHLHLVDVDATFFVHRLTQAVLTMWPSIKNSLMLAVDRDAAFKNGLFDWAVKQGIANYGDEAFYETVARQVVYRLLGKVIFYQTLRRHAKQLPEINFSDVELPQVMPTLQEYFAQAQAIDYQAIFEIDLSDEIRFPGPAVKELVQLVNDLNRFNFSNMPQDVIGEVFERLIPSEERHALGQYFTREDLVDFINAFCIRNKDDKILDPTCGTGTFLIRAYNRLQLLGQREHQKLLSQLWGVDIAPFPAELATINLYRQKVADYDNFPRILCENFFQVKPEQTFNVYDTYTLDRVFSVSQRTWPIALDDTGERLAVWNKNSKQMEIWNTQTGLQLAVIDLPGAGWCTFAPNSRTLCIMTERDVFFWNIEANRLKQNLPRVGGTLLTALYSPDGKYLAITQYLSREEKVNIYDTRSWELIQTFDAVRGRSVRFSKDSQSLSAISNGWIKIWNVETGELLQTLKFPYSVGTYDFSPDGGSVAISYLNLRPREDRISIYDITSLTEQRWWASSGQHILSYRDTTTLISDFGILWDVQTGTQIGSLKRSGAIQSLAITNDNQYIIDAEYLGRRPYGRLNIIEIITGDIVYSVQEDLSIVDIALNSDNTLFGYILSDPEIGWKIIKIVVREFPSGNLIREKNVENDNIEYDHRYITIDKTFKIINNLPTYIRYERQGESVRSYVSKSNVVAVSYGSWMDIYINGEKVHEIAFDLNRAPQILDISPDGALIATLGKHGAVDFYDTKTGVVTKVIEGTGSRVNTGFFSSDGRWFISATAADKGLIFVWNIHAPGIPRIVNTITSNSHPEPDLWYQNSHLLFAWTPPVKDPFGTLIPDQVVGYYVLLDQEPSTVLTAATGDLVLGLETDYPNTPDGTWYFHLAVELPTGDVPPVAIHRQVNIDTTAPEIISTTHPSPQEWSRENDVEVNWTVPHPSSVKRYHYIVDQNPNTMQTTSSWISTKETSLTLTDMGDGEHYVHVVWEDYAGNTGASVGNYELRIDTTPPTPVTELHVSKSGTDINLIWTESVDTTSGVAYYQVFRSTKEGVIGRNLVKDGTVTSGQYADAGAGGADIEYFYTIIPVDYANNSQREGNAQFSPLGALIRIEFAIELLTELQVGETFELRLRGTDEEGRMGAISAKEVDWEITNEIAVISETGVLTAQKIGQGTIKAVLKSNPEIVTKSIVITVGAGPVITFKPVKLIINKDSLGEVKINIDRVADFAGFEWRLSFDPQVLEAVEATEGNFLKQDEGETFPVGPNIDNTDGIISFANGRITPGGVNGEGVLMKMRFKGKKVGESPLTLTNVRLSNSSGHRIIATITPASVTVLENAPWDVNRDGLIDIFDIVIVGQNFGQEQPSDPRADVNRDGQVDITDLVLVGSHFGESAVVAAPSFLETFDSTVTPEKLIRIQQALTALETIPEKSNGTLVAIDFLRSWLAQTIPIITENKLLQNYPNPFNPDTWIPYELVEAVEVFITIHDTHGNLIWTLTIGEQASGSYRSKARAAYWDGRNQSGEPVGSGVYFYTLQAGSFSATRKMVIVK